jgi:hypothetical protein
MQYRQTKSLEKSRTAATLDVAKVIRVRSVETGHQYLFHVLLGPFAEQGLSRLSDVAPGAYLSLATRTFDRSVVSVVVRQTDLVP